MNSGDYNAKPAQYFAGARRSFIDSLPLNRNAKLLEIGCGNGDTGAFALNTGKCGWCAGVELCPGPAEEAASKVNSVILGDIETLDLSFPESHFDVLVMSEVLEHLRDPWSVLIKLRKLLKPGAIVLAGSPNAAHYSVIKMLLRGRWDYTSSGLMDHTHLRWFTPETYRDLFANCGYEVISVQPAAPLRPKPRALDRATFGKLRHMLYPQIYLRALNESK